MCLPRRPGRPLGLAIALAISCPAQAPALPAPTGDRAVGTVVCHWLDGERPLQYSPFAGDRRPVVAQLWYPADAEAAGAPGARLRAAFAPGLGRCPLVLICPGRGLGRGAYSTIAADLASHGFVAAVIDMPGIGRVTLPDGFEIGPDPAFRPPPGLMAGPYERVDEFFAPPTAIGCQDLELALAELRRLDAGDPTGRFTGHVDVDSIGVFGHSLGGRIAGAFAARQPEVRAYAAMEGIAPREVRRAGLAIPSAMLCGSGTLRYARQNYRHYIDGRRAAVFMVELQRFGHNSVTDLPLRSPARFGYDIDPRAALRTTVTLLHAFFDATLRGGADFAERCADLDGVVLTTWPAR